MAVKIPTNARKLALAICCLCRAKVEAVPFKRLIAKVAKSVVFIKCHVPIRAEAAMVIANTLVPKTSKASVAWIMSANMSNQVSHSGIVGSEAWLIRRRLAGTMMLEKPMVCKKMLGVTPRTNALGFCSKWGMPKRRIESTYCAVRSRNTRHFVRGRIHAVFFTMA